MNHNRARGCLSAFVDREVGAIKRLLLSRHIASCPSCLAEVEAIQAMRTSLRTNLTFHRASPNLAMRIGSALAREAPPAVIRPPRRLGFAGAAMAGGFAGVALTLAVTGLTPRQDPIVTEAVADHVRSLMADHLTDVATSDQHTVKPWLSARLELAPVVKDFAAEGYPLAGGRLDYLDGRRTAAIVYRRDKHIINLFVFVGSDREDSDIRQETRDGFNIVRWRMGGLSYVAVSDVEAAQLLSFARLTRGG